MAFGLYFSLELKQTSSYENMIRDIYITPRNYPYLITSDNIQLYYKIAYS